MPPEDEAEYRLADADRSNIVDWLSEEMSKASLVRRNRAEHSSFRRMTKYEYNYALQDLLGLPYPIANSLPPETASEDGFKNSSDLLQMSAMQFEAYRELGLKALERVTVRGERPQPVTYLISMQDEMAKAADDQDETPTKKEADKNRPVNRSRPHLLDRSTGEAISFAGGNAVPKPGESAGHNPDVSPVVVVLPRSTELKLNLDRFLPDEGMMRVRIRAGRTTMDPNEYAGLRLIFSAHTSNNANFSQVVSRRDLPVTASADKPEFIEFDVPLSEIQRNPFRKLETTFPRRDEFLHIRNESNARGGKEPLQVVIDYVEVSAPHYDQWPPQSHLDIFIASKNKSDEQVYGREVLTRFLERAWRRPVAAEEVAPFLDLFAKYRPDFDTFEEAMLEVLATALATPEFLYLTQRSSAADAAGPGDDQRLGTRESAFVFSLVEPARPGTAATRAGRQAQRAGRLERASRPHAGRPARRAILATLRRAMARPGRHGKRHARQRRRVARSDAARAGRVFRRSAAQQRQRHGLLAFRLRRGQRATGAALRHPERFRPAFSQGADRCSNASRRRFDFRRHVDDEFRRRRFASVEARRLAAGADSSGPAAAAAGRCSESRSDRSAHLGDDAQGTDCRPSQQAGLHFVSFANRSVGNRVRELRRPGSLSHDDQEQARGRDFGVCSTSRNWPVPTVSSDTCWPIGRINLPGRWFTKCRPMLLVGRLLSPIIPISTA